MAEGGLGALGLDMRSLIFQVVNFAILLLLLKQFALRPIIKTLEERRVKIAESLKAAQGINAAKAQSEHEQQILRRQAHQQAELIVGQSKQQGQEIIAAAQLAGQEKAQALLMQARGQIEQERQEIKAQLKRQTLDFVTAATEKIIGEKLDAKKDEALIRKALPQS